MKDLNLLNEYRLDTRNTHGWNGDSTCGCFCIPSPIDGQPLIIQASSNDGWDHVSVSRRNRCPNWPEMDRVHRLFFKDDEIAMQLHIPSTDHIDAHPFCLHLWKPHKQEIPLPPKWMV